MAYKKICMLDRVYHGLGGIITYHFCCFECCKSLLVKIPDIYENMNNLIRPELYIIMIIKLNYIVCIKCDVFINDNLWIKEKPDLQNLLNAVEN